MLRTEALRCAWWAASKLNSVCIGATVDDLHTASGRVLAIARLLGLIFTLAFFFYYNCAALSVFSGVWFSRKTLSQLASPFCLSERPALHT